MPCQHQTKLLDEMAHMMDVSSVEELWTIEWLSSLDATGATPQRKLEFARAITKHNFLVEVPFQTCYTLPNLAVSACGYLASKLKRRKWNDLEDEATLHGAPPKNLALPLFLVDAFGELEGF